MCGWNGHVREGTESRFVLFGVVALGRSNGTRLCTRAFLTGKLPMVGEILGVPHVVQFTEWGVPLLRGSLSTMLTTARTVAPRLPEDVVVVRRRRVLPHPRAPLCSDFKQTFRASLASSVSRSRHFHLETQPCNVPAGPLPGRTGGATKQSEAEAESPADKTRS